MRKDVNDLAQSAKVKVVFFWLMISGRFFYIICYAILKSAEAYDYVKRDLEELSATVQEEVSSTATALKQKLKVRLQSFHLTADLLILIIK